MWMRSNRSLVSDVFLYRCDLSLYISSPISLSLYMDLRVYSAKKKILFIFCFYWMIIFICLWFVLRESAHKFTMHCLLWYDGWSLFPFHLFPFIHSFVPCNHIFFDCDDRMYNISVIFFRSLPLSLSLSAQH